MLPYRFFFKRIFCVKTMSNLMKKSNRILKMVSFWQAICCVPKRAMWFIWEKPNFSIASVAMAFLRLTASGWKKKNTTIYLHLDISPCCKLISKSMVLCWKTYSRWFLYEICWHIKTLLNSNYKIENLLNDDEIRVYRELICETLSYIDDKHIVDFDLIGICFFIT